VIATKGSYIEQHRKIQDSGLGSFADHIWVMCQKSDAEWAASLANIGVDTDLSHIWAIGNSIVSDVNPLLRLGANGIHLHDANEWHREHGETAAVAPGRSFHRITRITDVLGTLPGTSALEQAIF
jgi:putative hydrolase of the HAD superfamily